MPIERKLAAIMFTDIAGYTAQMSKDEAVAISLLNKKESVLKPLISKHNGTYVKSTGDGSLSHFNSAVDAATCAKRFQESIYDDKNLNVRIGVHLGETIFEKGDIRGDGVNIASRLESMAVEGGVFVSKEVHDQLTNQKEFEGVPLGLQSMKGVGRLIEVYGLKGDKLSEPNPNEYQDNKIEKHSDDEVPSIAIIPFRNKGKEEDAFYAYGISADLITDCSGAGLIRVESLDRIEKIENYDKLDITALASKLLVRYVATGSLWKMDDVFQLSVELYDTKESKVLWSDRWQERWDNLIMIKGNISDGLLKALDLKPKIDKKVETTNTEAYEYYLKGKYKLREKRETIEDMEIGRGFLQKAIELDDNLLEAKNLLGWSYKDIGDLDKAMKIFTSTLKQGKELGDKRGIGYQGMGDIFRCRGEFDNALECFTSSLRIVEQLCDMQEIIDAQMQISLVYFLKGDLDEALNYTTHCLEISKEIGDKYGMGLSMHIISLIYWRKGDLDIALENEIRSLEILEKMPIFEWLLCFPFFGIGLYKFEEGDYDTAIEYLEKSLSIQKDTGNWQIMLWTTTTLFLSYKLLGRKYDETEIHTLIKEAEYIEEYCHYSLFLLLEDISYLETAYIQVQKLADNLEPDVAAKFLSYPIPKAIVEEWEKVK